MKRTASMRRRDSSSEREDTQSYRNKRDKNNMAVKKSREKSRQKESETKERVEQLKLENDELEGQVKMLSKELTLLKEMVINYATNVSNETTTSRSYNKQASHDSVMKDHDYSSSGETIGEQC